MSEQSKHKYLVLTCDTEALPREAPDHHVDRLIWGRFKDAAHEAGIGRMMDIADEFDAKVTFFLDVLEEVKYPGAIQGVARDILDRGHDLQLHMHIEFLPADFWARIGCQPVTWAMNLFDYPSARHLFEFGIDQFQRLAGHPPIAYRAGAFRYNAHILKALGDAGVPLSFQYYPATVHKPAYPHGFDAGVLPIFRWSNGVVEVPCGVYENPHPRGGKPRYTGFEFQELNDLQHCRMLMESYWQRGPGHEVMVMVLHSWSFLKRDATGYFAWQGEQQENLFREILANLPPYARVISSQELLTKIQQGVLKPQLDMPLCVAGMEGLPLYRLAAPALAS